MGRAIFDGDSIFGRIWVGKLKRDFWKSSELEIIFWTFIFRSPFLGIWRGLYRVYYRRIIPKNVFYRIFIFTKFCINVRKIFPPNMAEYLEAIGVLIRRR